MTSDAELYSALAEIFHDVFLREVPLSPQTTAADVPGWDSFRQIEILMAIEQRLGVRFSSRESEALASVGDLLALVKAKQRARGP